MDGHTVLTISLTMFVIAAVIAVLLYALSKRGDSSKGSFGNPYQKELRTFKHDEHYFVGGSDNGIVHHPDCPCGSDDDTPV